MNERQYDGTWSSHTSTFPSRTSGKGLLYLRPVTMIPRIFFIPSHGPDRTCMRNGIGRDQKIHLTPPGFHCYYICWSLFAFYVLVSFISFWCFYAGFFLRCMAFSVSFLSASTEPYDCLFTFLSFLIALLVFSRRGFLRLSQRYIVQILFRLLSSQIPRAAGRGRVV